jgi:hypothetical protein
MNNNTNNVHERVFYTYKSENKAIYVSPISANFGYILPISNQIISSNTSTFIYGRKPNCEMFIAPISLCKQFSKTFVSYKKYDKKLKEYSDNKRLHRYTDITEKEVREIKKSQSYPDLQNQLGLGKLNKLNKIMKIFDISPSYENCVNQYDQLDDYFFGASSEDFDFDD